jgi:WD domain, G-beta repeat
VRVWDLATGKQRRAVAVGSHPNQMALAPDGRTAACTGLTDRSIFLWETATGDQRGALTGYQETVMGMAYAPDGRTVATAGMDGTVRLWDAFTMKEIGRLEGHRGWVLQVAFSSDGTRLVSGGMDTTALVWDVRRFTQRPSRTVALTAADLEACWAGYTVCSSQPAAQFFLAQTRNGPGGTGEALIQARAEHRPFAVVAQPDAANALLVHFGPLGQSGSERPNVHVGASARGFESSWQRARFRGDLIIS